MIERSDSRADTIPLSRRVAAGFAMGTALVSGYVTARALDAFDRTETVEPEETPEQRINRQQSQVHALIKKLLNDATFTEVYSIVSDSVSNFEKKHPGRHRAATEIANILHENPPLFPYAYEKFVEEVDECIEKQSCTSVDASLLQRVAANYISHETIDQKLKALRKHENEKSGTVIAQVMNKAE